MVKGFKKSFKAIERAIGGRSRDKEPKAITKLKKQVLREQLKRLKAKKVMRVEEVKKNILTRKSRFFGTREEVQAELERKRTNRLRFLN